MSVMTTKYGDYEMVNGAIANDLIKECKSKDEKIKRLQAALEEVRVVVQEEFNSKWKGTEDDILNIINEALEDGK
jgi:hypothetical protein